MAVYTRLGVTWLYVVCGAPHGPSPSVMLVSPCHWGGGVYEAGCDMHGVYEAGCGMVVCSVWHIVWRVLYFDVAVPRGF